MLKASLGLIVIIGICAVFAYHFLRNVGDAALKARRQTLIDHRRNNFTDRGRKPGEYLVKYSLDVRGNAVEFWLCNMAAARTLSDSVPAVKQNTSDRSKLALAYMFPTREADTYYFVPLYAKLDLLMFTLRQIGFFDANPETCGMGVLTLAKEYREIPESEVDHDTGRLLTISPSSLENIHAPV